MTKEVLAEAREISKMLVDVADLSKDIFANIAADLEVPVQQARALCLLENPVSMSELASRLGCDKSYITPLADQMEAGQLISRVPGPDRRTKLLELSGKGAVLRSNLEKSVEKFTPIMVNLNTQERQVFRQLLEKILSAYND